ncbi:hypothetical protein [Rhizobium sp. BE258]|uniref:hypothetical protein n=1 Tax=unclassified Rhizobium TaxID=2613769 RepID=UPI000DDAD862|nr:hypothetical protein [Rhizobium sp. BE258]MDR7147527.1 hypothetical protein [Rhizobium sp. BE258]
MKEYDHRYVELTAHLRSVEAFCDFLSQGGTVRIAERDGGPLIDVTNHVVEKHRRQADGLRQTRRHLFPERADEDFRSELYSSH